MPHPHHPNRAAASAIALLLDAERVGKALAPWLPDPAERDFIVRCILQEGPIHHRGSSYALVALAGLVAERLGLDAAAAARADTAVPMRLPPHLQRPDQEPPAYPLRLDGSALARVGGREGVGEVLADALTDGPPHHALANVALVNLLTAILRRVEAG